MLDRMTGRLTVKCNENQDFETALGKKTLSQVHFWWQGAKGEQIGITICTPT